MIMSLEDNNGTQYHFISCDVPSDIGLDLYGNNGTNYYWNSANDYILYGQDDRVYVHPQSNNGSEYYFLSCSVPSTVGINLEMNNGTAYYYSSAFNCVKFCAGGSSMVISLESIMEYVWDEYAWDEGTVLGGSSELLTWTGSRRGHVWQINPSLATANRARIENDSLFINGVANATSRYALLCSYTAGVSAFGGNQPAARRIMIVMETDFYSVSASPSFPTAIVCGDGSSSDEQALQIQNTTLSAVVLSSAVTITSNGATIATTNLSAFPVGNNTVLLELGDMAAGARVAINEETIFTNAGYWSNNRLSFGALGYEVISNSFNRLPMKIKGIMFLQHPDKTTAIPSSALSMAREYLKDKFSFTY